MSEGMNMIYDSLASLQKPMKKWNVSRYFDDVFEKVMSTHETREDAQREADKLNNIPRAYVCFLVREQP